MLKKKSGFTLVELLIVISIIALLIGILLPALSEARRSARVTLDLANLKEHGTMKENYAVENRGRMPNAPAGRGIQQSEDAASGNVTEGNTGARSRPATVFAHKEFYVHNGWGVNGGFRHDHTWKLYNVAFGDYMLPDATGLQLLNEIFVSPGEFSFVPLDSNYEALKTLPDAVFPDDYGPGSSQPPGYAIYSSEGEDDSLALFCNPSYRYTLTGIMGTSELTGESFWGSVAAGPFGSGGAQTVPWTQGQQWANYRSWVQADSFQFPSDKVMFFNIYATHNRNADWYTFDGQVDIPVVFVDGHAETVSPSQDIPDPQDQQDVYEEAYTAGDFFAVSQDYTWSGEGVPGTYRFPGDNGFSKNYAWFAAAAGGTAGRDFR